MAGEFEKFDDSLNNFKKNLSEIRNGSKDIEQGVGSWAKAMYKISETQKDINHTNEQILKAEAEKNKWLKKNGKELKRLEGLGDDISDTEQEILNTLKLQLAARNATSKSLKKQNEDLKESLATQKESVKEANKLKAIFKSTGNFAKKWGFDKLRDYGVFQMDKEIRNAARSMGVGNSQYKAFADTMSRAADSTTMMGVNVKQLAKLQRGYSEEIGRSVRLTEGGLKAMAGMSEGTGLGEQYAIGMAASMDNFGVGVEASSKLVEDTMNTAGEMGVNASKAASTLQKNLKFAQKYNFKGGVKALGKMSADALRLKLDMDGIAGLAEKVFRPEGAIEMAAQLTTMGGEFAKLGDPMQLMFKARNDFEGFARDIGKASAEFVQYNKESGEFELKGGLAADRMREISKMTGLSVEKLQEMAVAQKRIEAVGAVSPISMNKKDMELVSSLAENVDGEWKINVGGFSQDVKDLKDGDIEKIRAEQQSLEQRAKEARTFEDTMSDFMDTLKQTLLPLAIELKDGLGVPLQKFADYLKQKKVMDGLRSFAKSIGSFAKGLVKFVVDNPMKSFIGAIAGWGALKAATWIFNGKMLRLGFNMGGPMGGGPGGGPGGAAAGGASRLFNTRNTAAMSRMGMSRMGQIGMNMRGAAGSAGAIGGGVLAAGMAGYNEYQENKEMGMKASENAGRTAAKGISAGLGAWGGAAAGAAIGSVVPVIGTVIGGLIGGAIGAFGGGALGETVGDSIYGDEARSGKNQSALKLDDGVIFNTKDSFTGVKEVNGAIIAGTNKGGNEKLAKAISADGSSSVVNHKHENQTITIKFEGLSEEFAQQIIDKPNLLEKLNNNLLAKRASISSGGPQPANPNFT